MLQTFTGNQDRNGQKKNTFPEAIIARYLRIHPLEWEYFAGLRLEVLGCQPLTRLKPCDGGCGANPCALNITTTVSPTGSDDDDDDDERRRGGNRNRGNRNRGNDRRGGGKGWRQRNRNRGNRNWARRKRRNIRG